MHTVSSASAAGNPILYINQLHRELPGLYARGGQREEVERVVGGLSAALETLHVPRGSVARFRLYPPPENWTFIIEAAAEADHATSESARMWEGLREHRLGFPVGGDVYLLLVRASDRWLLWSPERGHAPRPENDRMHMAVVILHPPGGGVTQCDFTEAYGDELPVPLYKLVEAHVPAPSTKSNPDLAVILAELACQVKRGRP